MTPPQVLEMPGRTVSVQLWDILGQDRVMNMTHAFYQSAAGALIVFDGTDMASFQHVPRWMDDIDMKVQLPDGNPIPCILVANKCDLPDQIVDDATLKRYAREAGVIESIRTSALSGENVDDAFGTLIDRILKASAPPMPPPPPPFPQKKQCAVPRPRCK
eukprot:TRINITY_DN1360_c0_g1_i1.p2 TRINITY_DN1360_c0_g1~~TRINITY_DN1360_c0_g1_i1.p2  ORF type:complete len:160 (+),score=31.80 TRINITY_DN1360_c0_g1_i1:409-888(+)